MTNRSIGFRFNLFGCVSNATRLPDDDNATMTTTGLAQEIYGCSCLLVQAYSSLVDFVVLAMCSIQLIRESTL